jgi:hypothetical protein
MARLDIFVSAHCFGCTEAHRLAEAVAEHFETLPVRVVDLDGVPEARPENVVAVPAYLLDDQIIWFGNPRQTDLFDQIERALAAESVCPQPMRPGAERSEPTSRW